MRLGLKDTLKEIARHPGSRLCPPADDEGLRKIEAFSTALPEPHRHLLALSNGVSVFHGHISLFGLGCHQCVDLLKWNNPATWKFAWPTMDLSRWICFGQTSWGEQYAYNLNEIESGSSPRIYQLGLATLKPVFWSEDFEEFVEQTLLGMARFPPIMEGFPQTYEKFGELQWGESIAHVPSLFLRGQTGDVEEMIGDVDHMMRMDSVQQMIIDGDIFTQCTGANARRPVRSVAPYQDDLGRMRMRVNFADEG